MTAPYFTATSSSETSSFAGALEAGRIGAGVTTGDFYVDAENKAVYVGRLSTLSGDSSAFYVRNRVGTILFGLDDASGGAFFRTGVGIGSAEAPIASTALNIVSSFATPVVIRRTASNNVSVRFQNDVGSMYAGLDGNTSNFSIGTSAALSESAIATFTQGGNVGIGERNPGATLSVSGGATIGSAYDTSSAPSNGLLVQGGVGIGTISAFDSSKVSIAGSNTTLAIGENDNNFGLLQWNDAGDYFKILTRVGGTYYDNTAVFKNGNVGIGTTNLQAKLHLETPAVAGQIDTLLRLENSGTAASAGSRILFSTQNDQGDGAIVVQRDGASTRGVMRFYTGSGGTLTERLTIEPVNGNVGIGTNAPANRLSVRATTNNTEVYGDYGDNTLVRLRLGYSHASGLQSNFGSQIYTDSSGDLLLAARSTSGTEKIRFYTPTGTTPTLGMIIDGGNVGIGTGSSALGSRLLVKGSTSNNTASALNVTNSGDTSMLFVRNDGNIGIGTTDPTRRLELSVSSNNNAQIAYFGNGSNAATISDKGRISLGTSGGNPAAMLDIRGIDWNNGNAGVDPLILRDNSVSIRFIVKHSGDVGIGTETPASRLNIGGDRTAASWTTTGRNLAIDTNTLTASTGSGTIATRVANSFGIPTFASASATTLTNAANVYIGGAPAAGTNTTITNAHALHVAAGNSYFGGNIGIGTTNPNQGKVEVKGGSVCVDTDSDDNASSCIADESDERLKRNIVPLDAAASLDAVLALNPVSFDWRVDDPDVLAHYPLIARFAPRPHSIGLIAQDVLPIVPEAIDLEMVGDGVVQYYQLDYAKFIPHLVGAVKQLAAQLAGVFERLAGHDGELASQRAQIAALEARIAALEGGGGGAAPAAPPHVPEPEEPAPEAPLVEPELDAEDEGDDNAATSTAEAETAADAAEGE